MNYSAILIQVSRINPAIWDAIFPQGPLVRHRYDSVGFNPRSLPPGPTPDGWQLEAGLMARELVRVAVESDLRGEDSASMVSRLIEDWCGTPWPRQWPFPWPGPGPMDGPHPDPWRINAARIVGATVFASYASRLGEGALREALADGAERLAQVAVES